MRRLPLVLFVLAACGDDSSSMPDAGVPSPNLAREIVDTQLAFDVTAMSGTATVTFGPSTMPGATVEVGDLTLDSVSVPTAINATVPTQLDLQLPASSEPASVEFAFHYKPHTAYDGVSSKGYTLVWPYYCGNMFPCHSQPSDGTTFTLALSGVPATGTAVYPTTLTEAPSYQIAWSIAAYTELPLGTTTAGTQLSVWYQEGQSTAATTGTQHLVAAFDWLEKTLGPYRFGPKAGTVSVGWGPGALGGMEHHPYWHVASAALGKEEVNVHESAHGWFGDGIRIQCWEDFVLSEGTVSYLAARALDVVAPSVGTGVWNQYANELGGIPGTALVWPQSCGAVDILDDHLFTNAPYMRGAFFYKGIADKVGPELVDQALAQFYAAHAGSSATMQDMLDTLKTVTGYDPTTCADMWLKSTTKPTPGPCP